MRWFLVSPHLLVLLSVVSISKVRAQTTSATTTTVSTAESTTLPATSTTPVETTTTTPEPTTTTESTTLPATSTTPETTTTTPEPTTTTESTTLPATSTTPETTTTTPEPTTTTTGITTAPGPTTLSETTMSASTVSTTIATKSPWTAPAIFYPFGAAAGDTEILEFGGDTSQGVAFSTPFTYFNRTYSAIYVNNNGVLTFNQPLPEADPPYRFPTYGNEDYIAPLLTDLDDIGIGIYSFQEYTNGSVLTRATQDINQHFPGRGFTASWVFVATWDYVQTTDMNEFNRRAGLRVTVQAVLISAGGFSFVLMHYGNCDEMPYAVGAGYDTVGSTDYYQIHYDPNNGHSIPILKNSTNVGVPGRWAFFVNNGSDLFVIGVQMKLKSFSDLTQSGNIEVVLDRMKQELVDRGLSGSIKMKLRKVKKMQP